MNLTQYKLQNVDWMNAIAIAVELCEREMCARGRISHCKCTKGINEEKEATAAVTRCRFFSEVEEEENMPWYIHINELRWEWEAVMELFF